MAVFGWLVPDNHILYKTYKRTLRNATISTLVYRLVNDYWVFQGIKSEVQSAGITIQAIPAKIDTTRDVPFSSKIFRRTNDCEVLIPITTTCCKQCTRFKSTIKIVSIQAPVSIRRLKN